MKSLHSIKTILYDLDGTLRFNQPSGRDFFLDHVVSLGVPVSAGDRRRTAIWEHRYWADSPEVLRDVAEFTDPDLFWVNYSRRQLEAAGTPAAQAQALAPQIQEIMKTYYRPQDVILPETYEVLGQLREAGYVLGVVSNRERPFGEYLAERGLAALVHFSISGGEAGSKKPDRRIFEYALRQAGMNAAEALYVGDSYFADVIGARGAGIKPVLYDPGGVFDGFALPMQNAPADWQAGQASAGFGSPAQHEIKLDQVPVIRAHSELLSLLDGRDSWPGNRG